MKDDELRRRELAQFLRSRRERVKPQGEARFSFSKRRTPGLRREEVAELAGVSASWYTWLEQGRDVRPSAEFLIRLAQVLKLNSVEQGHLFDLAGREIPESGELKKEEIPEGLRYFVMEVLDIPAFVRDERFEFILWNDPFAKQVLDLSQVPRPRRTLLDLIFIEKSIRRGSDWEELARRTVAEFRFSAGKSLGDPWVRDLITRIAKDSPEFARIWRLRNVTESIGSRTMEIAHPEKTSKKTLYLRSIYIPAEAENLRVYVLSPITATRAAKLFQEMDPHQASGDAD